MQRHPELATLSREHLSALMLVYCLKHGRSSNPRYPWPTAPQQQAERVLKFWEQEMRWHFEAEERCLFAPLQPHLSPALQAMGAELAQEHVHMKSLILSLSALAEAELQQALHKLAQLLETHVRREERQYFEGLQAEVPKLLGQAHEQLQAFYAQREPFVCIFTGQTRQVGK